VSHPRNLLDEERVEALRRRVQKEPSSIAFAQLAEEYRRAGLHRESVEACRAGLAFHPEYLSARVTLGRALIELGRLREAQRELDVVRKSAPENLTALRGLGEIHRRRSEPREALALYEAALAIAPGDPGIEQIVGELRDQLGMSQAKISDADRRTVVVLEQWLTAIGRARA
jgi:tetratricopeptide (TPR) repeat protein